MRGNNGLNQQHKISPTTVMRRYAKTTAKNKSDRAASLALLAEALRSADPEKTRDRATYWLERWRGAVHPNLLFRSTAFLGDLCYPST